jgi:hypothetical protein
MPKICGITDRLCNSQGWLSRCTAGPITRHIIPGTLPPVGPGLWDHPRYCRECAAAGGHVVCEPVWDPECSPRPSYRRVPRPQCPPSMTYWGSSRSKGGRGVQAAMPSRLITKPMSRLFRRPS